MSQPDPLPSFALLRPVVKPVISQVLESLAGAAVATQPPEAVLTQLTPILRQRVQLLSAGSTEPWLRLLSYDPARVQLLSDIATSSALNPHPVSGEIEVDWDTQIEVRYRRLDVETLQTLVVLSELNIFFRLVFVINDPDGDDGWRVGEVGVPNPAVIDAFGGFPDINEAEKAFQATKSTATTRVHLVGPQAGSSNGAWASQPPNTDDDDNDDDDYWDRYDATPSRTPARTPAVKRSPAPQTLAPPSQLGIPRSQSTEAEDAYFALYDSVQPAMDNHDPDEEVHLEGYTDPIPPPAPAVTEPAPLNNGTATTAERRETSQGPTLAQPIPIKPGSSRSSVSRGSGQETHPRPSSSASSNASQTVAKLEEVAESRGQTEYGVKQHISRSIRSLFLLSRASGIDREEFERMVRTELDVLGMVEDTL